MEGIAITLGLVLALLWALRELRNEQLKTKSIIGLKKAIIKAEKEIVKNEKNTLKNADARSTVGFLNRLHKDDPSSD